MVEIGRFGILVAATLAVIAAYLLGTRLMLGAETNNSEIVTAVVMLLLLAVLGKIVLIAFSTSVVLACLLAVASAVLLMAGGATLLETITPEAARAAGPGAMAMMLPLVVTVIVGVPIGLLLRVLRALFS